MKVNQLDILLNGREEQNIFRLQVHMNQLVLVQVGNSTKHLCDNFSCILLRQEHATVYILIDLTEKISALAELGNDEKSLFVLENFLETKNVRVIQVLQ